MAKLVARKEAPPMTKGTLLDTQPKRPTQIVFKFKGWQVSSLQPTSMVTSLGEFKVAYGRTYLKVLSALGVGWIPVHGLVQHRPGEPLTSEEEAKVNETPRRESSKSKVKEISPQVEWARSRKKAPGEHTPRDPVVKTPQQVWYEARKNRAKPGPTE